MGIEQLAQEISRVAHIYDIQQHEKDFIFWVSQEMERYQIYRELYPEFDRLGYDLFIFSKDGFHILVAKFQSPERIWINLLLFVATVLTTTLAGAILAGVDWREEPYLLYKGLPFSIAIMGILGTHELGHYVVARKNGMKVSLPYFIPFPSFLGTMGAIIRHRGPIPDRKALFDVGAAGPLAGLAASIIVTIIGLSLPVEPPPPEAEGFRIGIPPLFGFLIELIQPDSPYIHPVAFAGWIGMFLTFLNLLPAGQLDGGHVARSMLGKYHEAVSQSIPLILMMLGTFLIFVLRVNGGIWIFWGFFTMIFASGGHPPPLDDERKLDMERIWLGILTFALGIACATPVPFSEA